MVAAIEKAWEGVRGGQEPFGACVVMDGEAVSITHNTVRGDNDVTAHAEMNAIRVACRKLKTIDLSRHVNEQKSQLYNMVQDQPM